MGMQDSCPACHWPQLPVSCPSVAALQATGPSCPSAASHLPLSCSSAALHVSAAPVRVLASCRIHGRARGQVHLSGYLNIYLAIVAAGNRCYSAVWAWDLQAYCCSLSCIDCCPQAPHLCTTAAVR